MNGGCDGSFGSRKLFTCPPNQGLFAQLNDVIKYDDFLFANPGKNSHLLLNTRKYPLQGYILGVLTHTTAWDRHWGGNITLLG